MCVPVEYEDHALPEDEPIDMSTKPATKPEDKPLPEDAPIVTAPKGPLKLSPESKAAHHVSKYNTDNMMVARRGQEFTLMNAEGVKEIQLKSNGAKGKVATKFAVAGGKATVPKEAPIGLYSVFADGKARGKMLIVFNPWQAGTATHYPDDTAHSLDTYVLADSGNVYYGAHNRWGYMNWQYHQFDPKVLEAVLLLIDELPVDKRASPALVSRHLTEVLNAGWEKHSRGKLEMEGVLWGRWDGEYDDGKSPTHWNGSREIFAQWLKNKRAVKYGQCWVFSSILVTALRSLGMPARGVTNFRSGHDTPDWRGKYDHIVHYEDESVWNFHVWVEGFMTRPDLGAAGNTANWNAVDATPQEESDGAYRMGPALVSLVRENKELENKKNYDAAFLVGEVNAVHERATAYDNYDIGRLTLTQKVPTKGNFWEVRGEPRGLRQELMSEYKKCETALHTVESDGKCKAPAAGKPGSKHGLEKPKTGDDEQFKAIASKKPHDPTKVATAGKSQRKQEMAIGKRTPCLNCFRLEVAPTDAGKDVHAKLIVSGKARKKSWKIRMVADMIVYNGKSIGAPVLEKKLDLHAGDSKAIKFVIKAEKYEGRLRNTADMSVMVSARELRGGADGEADFDEQLVFLAKPHIDLVVSKTKTAFGGATVVTATLTNPLTTEKLKGCKLSIDTSEGDRVVALDGRIRPGGTATKEIRTTGTYVATSLTCKNVMGQGWSRSARWTPDKAHVLDDSKEGSAGGAAPAVAAAGALRGKQ